MAGLDARKVIDTIIGVLVVTTLVIILWSAMGSFALWTEDRIDSGDTLRISNIGSEIIEGKRYITAEMSNPTGENIPYLRVIFGLYDDSERLVSSVFQEEYDLAPGEIRDVRITFNNPDISRYGLIFAEGWKDLY